jgi:hypothetical protein
VANDVFPVVDGFSGTNSGGNVTSTTPDIATLTGTPNVGDLILIIIAKDGTGAFTWPGTWNVLTNLPVTFASTNNQGVFSAAYRVWASGDTNPQITHASEGTAHQVYRIRGGTWRGTPEVQQITGDSTNPNPPNNAPSWGDARAALWISAGANDGNVAITAGSASPGSWSNFRNDRWANTGGVGVATSRSTQSVSSLNPDVLTMNTEQWAAATFAIQGCPPILPATTNLPPIAAILPAAILAGSFFAPVEPPVVVYSPATMSWAPEYPDPYPDTAYYLLSEAPGHGPTGIVVPEHETPIYPDRLPHWKLGTAAETQSVQPSPSIAPTLLTQWAPRYPDFARAAQPPLIAHGLTKPPDQIAVAYNPAGLEWLPIWPQAERETYALLGDQPEAADQVLTVPPLSWKATYPDWIARPTAPHGGSVGRISPPDAAAPAPDLSWQPEYPDQIHRLTFHAGQQWYWAKRIHPPDAPPVPFPPTRSGPATLATQAIRAGARAGYLAPSVSWLPRYVDFAGRQAPRIAWNLPFSVEPFRTAAPLLSWKAQYPDRVWPPKGLAAYLQQSHRANILPIAAPEAPALSWQPEYPDFARGPRPNVAIGFFTTEPPRNAAPFLSWAPEYPDRIWPREPLVPVGLLARPWLEPVVVAQPDALTITGSLIDTITITGRLSQSARLAGALIDAIDVTEDDN